MIALKVENLSKTYRLKNKLVHAVSDISFEVKEGEGYGIIGHNGAGKTTVLKMLAGHLKPSSGSVKYNGGISSLIDLGWSMHKQLSGYENIVLGAGLLGIPAREARSRTPEIIGFSDLDPAVLDQPLYTFSNGMYLKLAFAIMMRWPQKIMLFDEVLSVGDVKFALKMAEKLMQLKKSGHSLIIVSHNLEQINAYCDRIMVLNKGQNIFEGTPTQATRKYYEIVHRKHNALPATFKGIELTGLTATGVGIPGNDEEVLNADHEISIRITANIGTGARHDLILIMEDIRGHKLFGDETLDWPLAAVSGACEMEWTIPAGILNRGNFSVQLLVSANGVLQGNLGILHFKTESSAPERINASFNSAFYLKDAFRVRNQDAFLRSDTPVKIKTGLNF